MKKFGHLAEILYIAPIIFVLQFQISYYTGDIPAHNIWNQTRNDQIASLKELTNYYLKYLPSVRVFPTLGNHEGVPVNA